MYRIIIPMLQVERLRLKGSGFPKTTAWVHGRSKFQTGKVQIYSSVPQLLCYVSPPLIKLTFMPPHRGLGVAYNAAPRGSKATAETHH